MRERDGYRVKEVAGGNPNVAAHILWLNDREPSFPGLSWRHLVLGQWWLVYFGDRAIAFAGMVPFHPIRSTVYFKRGYVMPDHRGRGIQRWLMEVREAKAIALGYDQIVSDCAEDNEHSAANFRALGFSQVYPEQPWARVPSLYWSKELPKAQQEMHTK